MRWRSVALLVVMTAGLMTCRSQPASNSDASEASPARDLSRDEAHGGHTLKRHVGLSEAQLRTRLEQEPNISAASSYTNRHTAERVVGAAIAQSEQKIGRWIERGVRRPNLALDYDEPNDSIGRVMYRGAMGSVPCDHAVVVLRADGARDYFVLTSYPECRP